MNAIQQFTESIKLYLDEWRSIDIRSVCFLAYGKWINLGTRLLLSEKAVTVPIHRGILPVLPNFCALHELADIKELNNLLAQIEKGAFSISDKVVHFAKIENNEVKIVPPSFNLLKYRRGIPYFPIDFPYIQLRSGASDSIHTLLNAHSEALNLEELDWRLRSLNAPHNGVDDLLINFLNNPRAETTSGQSAITEVTAPIGLRLGNECSLSGGEVTIHVENVGPPKFDVAIGLIALTGPSPVNRMSYALTKEDWDEGCSNARKKIRVDSASSVSIFLTFRGNALELKIVNDRSALLKNPMALACSHFDEGPKTVERYITGKGKDAGPDFEIGIAFLLHFCGFNVGPYGRVDTMKEGIDLIAFDPSSNYVLAAECTSKDLDTGGKLSKFSRRVKELKALLPDFKIIPLICTPLGRQKIASSEIQRAESEQLGVLAAEEIQHLLQIAGQNKETQVALEYLQSLIKIPDDTLFWSS